jgi:hypothetical protein
MNGHSIKENPASTNSKSINSHPHDWHREIKVSKILFYFLPALKNRKENMCCCCYGEFLFC